MSKFEVPGIHWLHLAPVTNVLQLQSPVTKSHSWSKLPAKLQSQVEQEPVVLEKLKKFGMQSSHLVPPTPEAT
jgi:hypothetical protein